MCYLDFEGPHLVTVRFHLILSVYCCCTKPAFRQMCCDDYEGQRNESRCFCCCCFHGLHLPTRRMGNKHLFPAMKTLFFQYDSLALITSSHNLIQVRLYQCLGLCRLLRIFGIFKFAKWIESKSKTQWTCLWNLSLKPGYSNTSQTRGSKLANFSNSQFLSLFFTSNLAVPFISTQIRNSCFF